MAIIPATISERGATVPSPYCRISFRGHVTPPGGPRQLEYLVVRRHELEEPGAKGAPALREVWYQVGDLRRFAPSYDRGAPNEMTQAYQHLRTTDPQFKGAKDDL